MNDSAIRHLTELLREDAAGEFEIGRQLGRGGMAVVFLAKETKLDRQVAIKVLPPELTFGHGVDRFMREAKTAAKLDHPNIIPIYRISDGGKIFWYAMKFREGQSLDQRLTDTGQMSLDEVLTLLEPVADALDYAHDQQVIHRDIKPANVMVDSRDRVIVTDFGIAKALTEGTLTASGSVIGTPYFMSPEQGMGKQVTGASDQYSVAVMAYQMLCGHLPFQGDSAIDILHKHCTVAPPPLKEMRPGLPDHTYCAINKALAKKPERRFSSVSEFVRGLKEPSDEITMADLETVSMPTPPSLETKVATEVVDRVQETVAKRAEGQSLEGDTGKKKSGFIVGVAAAAIVVVGGAGAMWLTRDDGASSGSSPTDSAAAVVANPSETAGQQTSGSEANSPETPPTEPTSQSTSHLTLAGVPGGAVVTIDGNRRMGTEFELAAGFHSVRVEVSGYEPFEYRDSLVAGERIRVLYRADPVVSTPPPEEQAVPDPPAPGFVRITIRPWANVTIDGRRFEGVNRLVDTLPAGDYILRFEHPELNNVDTTVAVRPGEATVVQIRLTGTG